MGCAGAWRVRLCQGPDSLEVLGWCASWRKAEGVCVSVWVCTCILSKDRAQHGASAALGSLAVARLLTLLCDPG